MTALKSLVESRRFDLNPRTLLESEGLQKFAAEYGARNAEELLAQARDGNLNV